MKIKGVVSADIRRFEIKSDNTNTGKEALVDVDVGFKKEEAAKKIGDDFVALAFSTMRVQENDEGENGYRFLVDSLKPGRNCILERHRIVIDEHEIEAQPELVNVKPVDGEARVIARIRIPVDTGKSGVINALVKMVGQAVKIRFNPQQGTLDFEKGNGNGHDVEHEDGESAEATGAEANA